VPATGSGRSWTESGGFPSPSRNSATAFDCSPPRLAASSSLSSYPPHASHCPRQRAARFPHRSPHSRQLPPRTAQHPVASRHSPADPRQHNAFTKQGTIVLVTFPVSPAPCGWFASPYSAIAPPLQIDDVTLHQSPRSPPRIAATFASAEFSRTPLAHGPEKSLHECGNVFGTI
jgi:hypothetical protein